MSSKLSEAIIEYLDEEITDYVNAASNNEDYSFSRRYLREKHAIIRAAEDRGNRVVRQSGHIPRESLVRAVKIRRIAVLVAVLIIVMAAVVGVVAVVKAYIAYNVEKEEDSWRITFEESGSNEEFAFEYIEPKLPEGFEEVERVQEERFLLIVYKNADGHTIEYAQQLPDGLAMYTDNNDYLSMIEKVNGMDVVINVGTHGNWVIFNDGRYIFDLSGNVDEEVLKDMAVEIINRISN